MGLDSAEREIVREIAYSEELIGTDLKPETLEQKIEDIRPRLHRVANQNETISYSELTDGFTLVHRFRIGRVLGIIGALECELGNPVLPAVVVKKQEGNPGEGFTSLLAHLQEETLSAERPADEVWEEHLREVHAHDW